MFIFVPDEGLTLSEVEIESELTEIAEVTGSNPDQSGNPATSEELTVKQEEIRYERLDQQGLQSVGTGAGQPCSQSQPSHPADTPPTKDNMQVPHLCCSIRKITIQIPRFYAILTCL